MRGWATRGLPPRTHLQCIRCAGLPRIGRVAGFPHEDTPQALDMSPCEEEHHWPCNWKRNQRERIDASVAPPPRGSGLGPTSSCRGLRPVEEAHQDTVAVHEDSAGRPLPHAGCVEVNRLQGIALKPVLRDQPEPDQRVVIALWHDQRLTVSERCDRVPCFYVIGTPRLRRERLRQPSTQSSQKPSALA